MLMTFKSVTNIIIRQNVGDWYLMLAPNSSCWWSDLSPISQTFYQHLSSPTSVTNIDVTFQNKPCWWCNWNSTSAIADRWKLTCDGHDRFGRTYLYGNRLDLVGTVNISSSHGRHKVARSNEWSCFRGSIRTVWELRVRTAWRTVRYHRRVWKTVFFLLFYSKTIKNGQSEIARKSPKNIVFWNLTLWVKTVDFTDCLSLLWISNTAKWKKSCWKSVFRQFNFWHFDQFC